MIHFKDEIYKILYSIQLFTELCLHLVTSSILAIIVPRYLKINLKDTTGYMRDRDSFFTSDYQCNKMTARNFSVNVLYVIKFTPRALL